MGANRPARGDHGLACPVALAAPALVASANQ